MTSIVVVAMSRPNDKGAPINIAVSRALEKRLQIDRERHSASPCPTSVSSATIRYWDRERRVLYHISSNSDQTELDDDNREEVDVNARTSLNDETQHILNILTPSPAEFDVSSYKQEEISNRNDGNDVSADGAVSYNKLCQRCWEMTHNSVALETRLWRLDESRQLQDETEEIFPHHRRLGDLQQSSSSGCHLCTLLVSIFTEGDRTLPLPEYTPYVVQINFYIYSEDYKTMAIQTSAFKSKFLWLQHSMPIRTPSPSLKHVNTGNPEVLSLAKTWLESCLATHNVCQRSVKSGDHFVPTRLVKVTRTSDEAVSAHLVIQDEIESDTPYLALSYCWGTQMPCTLTTENVSQFRESLPHALPKTLSDALSTTLFLGYNYIWIDCLCIMQNSRQDWEQEAASMGSVYQHSVCTIAAVGANNVHEGCFFERQPSSFLSCQLLEPTSDGAGNGRKSTHTQPNYRPRPLYTRGWVLQERVLSPRTINFGADEISWDCLQCYSSEEDISVRDLGEWAQDFPGPLNLKIRFRQLLQPINNTLDELNFCVQKWQILMTHYLECNLTYPEDKWPAIQGLATAVRDALGVDMIYGLWVNRLGLELLWSVYTDAAAVRVSAAPTWSWSGIHGPVSLFPVRENEPAIDAIIESNPGGADDRVLEIEGSVISMQYRAMEPGSRLYSMTTQHENANALLDQSDDGAGFISFDMLTGDTSDIKALQIAISPKTTDAHNNVLRHARSNGLVIRPTTSSNATATSWHRVGYYELQLTPERLDVFKKSRSKIFLR